VPSTVPFHASQMLSSNITAFLRLLVPNGSVAIDGTDEIIRSTLVTHEGRVVHPQVAELITASPVKGDEVIA
jgi:NAD(P) transhydrogenase subunit alpha